jgi:hypothetical protein
MSASSFGIKNQAAPWRKRNNQQKKEGDNVRRRPPLALKIKLHHGANATISKRKKETTSVIDG